MKQLILASSSPSRRRILEAASIPFTVVPSNFEEDMSLAMPPKELAVFLSKGKAADVAGRNQDAIVLGADSFAVYDGQLLGKPHTLERAREMLAMLSGRTHSFITGFTIIHGKSGKEYSEAVETTVHFRELSPDDITGYLEREDTRNNAGAYIIQGLGGALVESIEGDYFNVVGLPLSRVVVALEDFGVHILASD